MWDVLRDVGFVDHPQKGVKCIHTIVMCEESTVDVSEASCDDVLSLLHFVRNSNHWVFHHCKPHHNLDI